MSDPDPFVFYELQEAGKLVLKENEQGIGPEAQPGTGQILCRTIMTALSTGTELAAYRGDPPLRPQQSIYPRLVGYCNVATIMACGPDVPDQLRVGDRIISHQSHRSGFLIPCQDVLVKLPEDMDADVASVTYLFHLGYAAFLKSGAVQGDSAAMLGLGTLGLTTAALFANGGVPMTGFSNFTLPADILRPFGLEKVFPKHIEGHADQYDHVVLSSNRWRSFLPTVVGYLLCRQHCRIRCGKLLLSF